MSVSYGTRWNRARVDHLIFNGDPEKTEFRNVWAQVPVYCNGRVPDSEPVVRGWSVGED